MQLSLKSNAAEIIREMRQVNSSAVRKGISAALNRSLDGAEAFAKKEIRQQYKVKLSALSKAFQKNKSTQASLAAKIIVTGRPINLIAFGAKQNKRGVSVNIKGRRITIPHAFIAKVKLGGSEETSYVYKRAGKDRYPLRSQTTRSVPGMFQQLVKLEQINEVTSARFGRELRAYIKNLTRQVADLG